MSNYRTIKNYTATSATDERLAQARRHLDSEYWRDEKATAIVPKKTSNFVVPLPQRQQLPAQSAHAMTLDMTPSAVASIDVRTSHVDRAKGYLLSTVPLCFFGSLCVVILRTAWYSAPILSVFTLAWFFVVFVAAWLASYIYGYVIQSPEYVMLVEAKGKLKLLEREQIERWRYYNQETNRNG